MQTPFCYFKSCEIDRYTNISHSLALCDCHCHKSLTEEHSKFSHALFLEKPTLISPSANPAHASCKEVLTHISCSCFGYMVWTLLPKDTSNQLCPFLVSRSSPKPPYDQKRAQTIQVGEISLHKPLIPHFE